MSALLDRPLDPARKREIARNDMALNGHVHPMFAAMLDVFCQPATIGQIKREAYLKALKSHDWSHEYSDDHCVYLRGRESLAQLKLAQHELDPDFALWNEHCHPCCRNGASYQ